MAIKDTKYNKISDLIKKSGGDDSLLNALETFIQTYKEEKNREENLKIPLSIFSDNKLGILEALIKYLEENLSLKHSHIAKMLRRNDRTVWTSYNKAVQKQKEKIMPKQNRFNVPVNVFSDRKTGPLEALTLYLKDDLHLRFKEISKLLNRSYRTIWLSYRNGAKKRGTYEQ